MKSLLFAGVILGLIDGIATAQTALPEAPTNVGDVKWGVTVEELQKVRANANCRLDYEERSPTFDGKEQKAKYDLERGLAIMPVRFSATCTDSFPDASVMFLLEGNPPRFNKAYITYRDQAYTALRETFIKLYGQPSERDTQTRPRWRWLWWWSTAPSHDPERLIWRRPHATVTLYSADYAKLGRKSEKTWMVIESSNHPSPVRDRNAPGTPVRAEPK